MLGINSSGVWNPIIFNLRNTCFHSRFSLLFLRNNSLKHQSQAILLLAKLSNVSEVLFWRIIQLIGNEKNVCRNWISQLLVCLLFSIRNNFWQSIQLGVYKPFQVKMNRLCTEIGRKLQHKSYLIWVNRWSGCLWAKLYIKLLITLTSFASLTQH